MYQRELVLYTRGRSVSGWRTKRLLRRGGYHFKVFDTSNYPEVFTELKKVAHHEVALPCVYIDHRPVGSFSVTRALDRSGVLAHLLRDNL